MLLALLLVGAGAVLLLLKLYLDHVNSVEPNPFSVESLRQPEGFVADKKTRKAVLKRKFSPEEVPQNLDAVIIGSGIGGLSCGAILSKSGKKVLVLEQHGRSGGCCHTFNEKGIEFDVGIHYIGEMGANTLTRNLSDQITNNQLEWAPLEDHFDSMIALDDNNKEFKYYNVRSKTMDELKSHFPDEVEAIDKFYAKIESERGSFIWFMALKLVPYWIGRILVRTGLIHKITSFFHHSEESLWDVVSSFTKNEQLKTAFVYLFMDYGTKPKNAAWPIHWMLVDHYKHGAFYPKGGASQIPFTTTKVIEQSGGKVLTKAPVSGILLDHSGKAIGVKVNETEIYAPIIISDAGVLNTFRRLLPAGIGLKSRYHSYGEEVKSGESAFQIFVGLRGSSEELGLKARNYWVYTNSKDIDSLDRFMDQSLEDAAYTDKVPVPIMFVSFPSAKDPTWEARFPGKSSCIVAGPANFEWFKEWNGKKVKKRGDEYDHLKRAVAERVLDRFREAFPYLADKIEFWDVGTPLTHVHYIAAPKGEMCGLNHSPYRFSAEVALGLRPKTDIPGLFLTGQDICVCGFTGAMFGGLACASAILNRNLMTDLMDVKKQRAKPESKKTA